MNFTTLLTKLSIFGEPLPQKNILPISCQDLSDGYVDVDEKQQEDFILIEIHEKDEIDFLNDLENQIVSEAKAVAAEQMTQGLEEEKPAIAPKSPKQMRWESQYPRIFATVMDKEGNLLEIRRVNKEKQLAFWDQRKNAQVYVYRTKNLEELATQEKMVLTMKK